MDTVHYISSESLELSTINDILLYEKTLELCEDSIAKN